MKHFDWMLPLHCVIVRANRIITMQMSTGVDGMISNLATTLISFLNKGREETEVNRKNANRNRRLASVTTILWEENSASFVAVWSGLTNRTWLLHISVVIDNLFIDRVSFLYAEKITTTKSRITNIVNLILTEYFSSINIYTYKRTRLVKKQWWC